MLTLILTRSRNQNKKKMDAIFERNIDTDAGQPKCQVNGCSEESITCKVYDYTKEDYINEFYCSKHAMGQGYCGLCGLFSAGTTEFEFINKGYCDVCFDQLKADFDGIEDSDYPLGPYYG
ncbi:MAG: hypothetical protein DCC60_09605 [Ignavibacteriae bacterium]|nr:MAG: hypothetical protein DCC60_09605 [Ignavibacteriota bacterium]